MPTLIRGAGIGSALRQGSGVEIIFGLFLGLLIQRASKIKIRFKIKMKERSPPGPEFDPDKSNQTTENNFIESARAAGDLRVSGHLRTERPITIVELGHDQKTSLRQTVGRQ